MSMNKTAMEDVRLSSSSPKRIWVKYGDGRPVSLVFDGDDVDLNRITLRRHDEEEDLRADLTVDENFVNSFDTPLQTIVNLPGMY